MITRKAIKKISVRSIGFDDGKRKLVIRRHPDGTNSATVLEKEGRMWKTRVHWEGCLEWPLRKQRKS